MKVKSTKSISFPKLNWSISAEEIKELPKNKQDQERILQENCIVLLEEKNLKNNNN